NRFSDASKPSRATAWYSDSPSPFCRKIGYSRWSSANSVGHTGTRPAGSPRPAPKRVSTRRSLWTTLSSSSCRAMSSPALARTVPAVRPPAFVRGCATRRGDHCNDAPAARLNRGGACAPARGSCVGGAAFARERPAIHADRRRGTRRPEKRGRCFRNGPVLHTFLALERFSSEGVADRRHVPRALVEQAQHLEVGTRTPAHVLAGEVDRLQAHRPVVVQLLGDAEVPLLVVLDVERVGRVALVGREQVLVTPVPGQSRGPAVLLVHEHHVG